MSKILTRCFATALQISIPSSLLVDLFSTIYLFLFFSSDFMSWINFISLLDNDASIEDYYRRFFFDYHLNFLNSFFFNIYFWT